MSNLLENCSICNISNSVLIKISSADKNQVKWSRKLKLCVPAVDWGDDCGICPNCIGQLENAYNFYQLCLQSYEVRKQQAAFAVKLEPCYEPQEDYDVMVTNPIEDEVPSTINACFLPEVHMEPEIECLDVAKIDLKIEDISGNGNGNEDTPPEILDRAEEVVLNVLPNKSREVYECAYNRFLNWCNEKNVKSFTESVLLAYFSELSSKMKASTLWAHYSMVKATLNLKNGVNIEKYSKLRAYLKKQNHNYTPKKSRMLSKEQVDRFLTYAPDKQYLMMKVVLILGVAGACRCEELVHLKINDIEDLKSAILIKIPTTKTNKARSFTVMGDSYLNFYRKYVSLRPTNFAEPRFFIKYQNGTCHRIVVGIHKISSVPQEIAKFLNLDNAKEFTGHCFRRTSATFVVDADGDFTCLKRHGGQKSSTVAEGSVEDSLKNKNDTTRKMLGLDQPSTSTIITDTTSINYDDMEIFPKAEITEKSPEKEFSIQDIIKTEIVDL